MLNATSQEARTPFSTHTPLSKANRHHIHFMCRIKNYEKCFSFASPALLVAQVFKKLVQLCWWGDFIVLIVVVVATRRVGQLQ